MKKPAHRKKGRNKRAADLGRDGEVRRGPGRPPGSLTTHTIPGAPLHENSSRAIWGAAWSGNAMDAVTWTHQLWIALHQIPGPRTLGEHIINKSPDVIDREVSIAKEMFVDCVAKKMAAHDVPFFADVASEVKRLVEIVATPDSPYNQRRVQRCSLIFFVEEILKKTAGHRFTWAELLDGVDWRGETGTNFRPSHAQLKRLCGELKIPVARGKAQRIRRN